MNKIETYHVGIMNMKQSKTYIECRRKKVWKLEIWQMKEVKMGTWKRNEKWRWM